MSRSRVETRHVHRTRGNSAARDLNYYRYYHSSPSVIVAKQSWTCFGDRTFLNQRTIYYGFRLRQLLVTGACLRSVRVIVYMVR